MLERIAIHLLYASIVWIAAWLLTSMPRGSATTKYWIWVATSLYFILPISLIPDRFWPLRVAWLDPRSAALSASAVRVSDSALPLLAVLWSGGAAVMVFRLCLRIRRGAGASGAPAVIGLLRPHISLPEGIGRLLTRPELDAVLLHEQRHAKRHDNLILLIHEIGLSALWFHPLVWITGRRLALYRELSCDESVTAREHGPDLVSALAKLASPDDVVLLHATASSFIGRRLALLTATEPETNRAANALLSAAFAVMFVLAVVGPIAQAAARYACALTHASHGVIR